MTNEGQTTDSQNKQHSAPDVIAVPSRLPGGPEARLGIHFGRAECFTIMTFSKEQEPVSLVVDNSNQQGCVSLLDLLQRHGVEALATRHIGHRPLAALTAAGIPVYLASGENVGEAAATLRKGKLQLLSADDSCREDSPVTGRGDAHGQQSAPGHAHGCGNGAGYGERFGHGVRGRR